MSALERLMARRQVQAEIRADDVTIIPFRKTKIDTSDGGWKWGPSTPQEPIVCSIIPAKRRLSDMLVNTELGDVVNYSYIVLAPHDADLQPEDTFTWNGDLFVVKSINIKTEVSRTAQVDYFGGAQNHG